jgi:hypothetical protein
MFGFLRRAKPQSLDWRDLNIEPIGSNDYGPCSCCGNMSRTVWGYVHSPSEPIAAYFVQWTRNNPEHGANFDLILGAWGDQAQPHQRQAIALAYRVVDGQGSFMVIDAKTRPFATSELIGAALDREQVIGQPIAAQAFAVVDAVMLKDDRITEIARWQ